MPILLALLAAGIDPETEAVMGRRKPPAERRIKPREEAKAPPVIDPALEDCIDLARKDRTGAIARARDWIARGNNAGAQQCLGFAEAQGEQWTDAAAAFREGARLAAADGATASRLWAQAGNAALLGGEPAAAVASLDNALGGDGLPDGLARGEAYLDRARAHVALKDLPAARGDLDNALRLAPQDPLAWLLSATLARRMNDLPLAQRHIGEAVARAGDDASVALEQGVIAALSSQDSEARTAFARAEKLGGGTPVASAARAYLAQLDAPPAKTAPAPAR